MEWTIDLQRRAVCVCCDDQIRDCTFEIVHVIIILTFCLAPLPLGTNNTTFVSNDAVEDMFLKMPSLVGIGASHNKLLHYVTSFLLSAYIFSL